jgi:hypothetical protein
MDLGDWLVLTPTTVTPEYIPRHPVVVPAPISLRYSHKPTPELWRGGPGTPANRSSAYCTRTRSGYHGLGGTGV